MNLFLQLRLWAKEAPRTEVRTVSTAVPVLLALFVWALFPVGVSTSDEHDVGFLPAQQTDGTAYPPAGQTDAGQVPDGATTDPSAVVGETEFAGPAPDDGGGIVPEPVVAGPSDGGQSGTAGAPTPTAPLRATDRGVSATTVKVGFVTANIGGMTNAGLAATGALRDDLPEAIAAWANDVNKKGGINGRKVQPVVVSADLFNASDQRSKCLQLTETEKVFGVIDSVSMVYKPSIACFTVEHKMPFVNSVTYGQAFMRQGYPHHVSLARDLNGQFKDAVLAAREDGLFDSKKGFRKLGILSDDCDVEASDDPRIGLRAWLQQAGVPNDKISEFRVTCDLTSSQRQVAQAVLQHKADGVTHVMPAVGWPVVQAYLAQADTQLYKPVYRPGLSQLIHDGNQANFSTNQWDGTRGVSVTRVGEQAMGKPLSPLTQECSRVLKEHKLAPISDYNKDGNAEIVLLCENWHLFLKTAKAAGPELTRASWGAAAQRLGPFDGAFTFRGLFDRQGKVSGGDFLAVVQWRADCRCWHQVRDFKPGFG